MQPDYLSLIYPNALQVYILPALPRHSSPIHLFTLKFSRFGQVNTRWSPISSSSLHCLHRLYFSLYYSSSFGECPCCSVDGCRWWHFFYHNWPHIGTLSPSNSLPDILLSLPIHFPPDSFSTSIFAIVSACLLPAMLIWALTHPIYIYLHCSVHTALAWY